MEVELIDHCWPYSVTSIKFRQDASRQAGRPTNAYPSNSIGMKGTAI